VVLPGAGSAEKTGTLTNVDRTVHLCERAVEPPGEARADLDIFLEYARRMDFRDRDGEPLIKWHDPESAFEAWKECSRGRPCDYTGMTYESLRDSRGIQWPCTEDSPDGTERLYSDAVFNTDPDYAETFGQELGTGAPNSAEEYRAMMPGGRAILHAAAYEPSPEVPTDERPMQLTTGRTVYHFHTRTRTGRAPELNAAAPEVWVELSAPDAERLGVTAGDTVRVESARGEVEGPARITGIRPGAIFVPFHYGYWDEDSAAPNGARPRAANEMTITAWDPVSKQPLFKLAAVAVRRVS
jgi:anaerobic selenocysteine-containing dehydrogenase